MNLDLFDMNPSIGWICQNICGYLFVHRENIRSYHNLKDLTFRAFKKSLNETVAIDNGLRARKYFEDEVKMILSKLERGQFSHDLIYNTSAFIASKLQALYNAGYLCEPGTGPTKVFNFRAGNNIDSITVEFYLKPTGTGQVVKFTITPQPY